VASEQRISTTKVFCPLVFYYWWTWVHWFAIHSSSSL
jgi:hypothetical protein